jgi:hypothetical protein
MSAQFALANPYADGRKKWNVRRHWVLNKEVWLDEIVSCRPRTKPKGLCVEWTPVYYEYEVLVILIKFSWQHSTDPRWIHGDIDGNADKETSADFEWGLAITEDINGM